MNLQKLNIKYILLIILTAVFLLHKLREFPLYNVSLISVIIISLIVVFLSKKGLISFNSSTGVLFLIYIFYLPVIIIITAININRFGMETNTFLVATSRLYLMPIFVFLIVLFFGLIPYSLGHN